MKLSGKVLFVLIAFTLILNLYCQEDSAKPQVPLLSSTTDAENNGSTGETDTGSPLDPGEQVADGPVTDQGDAIISTTISSETPYVKSISNIIKHIPDAENAFFTDTGRLFVTGNTAIFEITERGTKTAVFSDYYGIFGGIAQAGKWLYVIYGTSNKPLKPIDLCSIFKSGDILTILQLLTDLLMDKNLLRADLSVPGPPVFTVVHTFKDMLLPNGMAADADGNLYVADETFLPKGKIIKLTVSGDNNPVVTQETWISYKDGCFSPNGVVIRGNTLYFTDFSLYSLKPAKVKKVAIIDGRPGTVETVYSSLSFFDDLDAGIYRNQPYVAVADYLTSSIILINEADGLKTRLGSGKIANPSSVHFGAAPQFKENELVITEKGMLYEMYSGYGNKLSCITLPE